MNIEKKIEVIDRKVDALVLMVCSLPLFIKAPNDMNARHSWYEARNNLNKIIKQYEDIIKNEYNSDIAGIENKVPKSSTRITKESDTKAE